MNPSDLQTCSSSNESPEDEATKCLNSLSSFPSIPSLAPPYDHLNAAVHHQCLLTLRAHQNSYTSSLVLAGEYLFTGSSNREIRQWNLTSLSNHEINPTEENTIVAGNGAIKSLVATSDMLISAHQDHKIRVWKIHEHRITQLATLPTITDRAIKLLLPKNHVRVRRHKKCTWVHHVDTVSALILSNDQSLLYSVSWDRSLKIWRTTDFKCLESVTNAHDDAINAVAVSDDGHIYTGSSDKKIKIWRKKSGEKSHCLVDILEKHNSGVNALALSGDGMVLYSGASDRSILVWMDDGGASAGGDGGMAVVGALRGHSKAILCLATVSELLCSGSADKTVRIWRGSGKSYSCLAILQGHNGPIKCITGKFDCCSSDAISSYDIYSASLDCDIKVWKIFLPIY